MTIRELFDYLQEVKPHQYEEHILMQWLNVLEKRICEFYAEFEDNEVEYIEHTDVEESLLVDELELYAIWLAAKIDFHNYEYTYYNNDVLVFNELWEEFQSRHGRTHTSLMPKYLKI